MPYSAGRSRGGSFNRRPQAISRPNRGSRDLTPTVLAGIQQAREINALYGEALDIADNFDLSGYSVIPEYLEPIGDSGFYVTPNEPVDPTDCERYPGSPWCGGSGFDRDAIRGLSPIGLNPDYAVGIGETCVSISPTLFGVNLAPLTVCYRSPDRRPNYPPEPELPEPEPNQRSEYTPFADAANYSTDCVFMTVIAMPHYIDPSGEWQYRIMDARRHQGRLVGIHSYTLPDASIWRTDLWAQSTTLGLRAANATETGVLSLSPDEMDQSPLPYVVASYPEAGNPINQSQACVLPDNSPPYRPNRNGDDMACNCGEIEDLLRIIALRLGTSDYPVKVPKSLVDDSNQTEDQQSLTQLNFWLIKQLDALFGQFPIEIEIKDVDPTQEGDQTQRIKLPNLAEAIAELFGTSFKSAMNSDLAISFLLRLAAETIGIKNAAIVTQDYARANALFLGYKGNPKERKVNYSFNPEGLSSLETILDESEKSVMGWENDQDETLMEYQTKLMFAAGIIKSVFFRSRGQADDLIKQFTDILSPDSDENRQRDRDWEEFVQKLNNPESEFNLNSPIKPRVRDREDQGNTESSGDGSTTAS